MKRGTFNPAIDLLAFLAFSAMVGSGYVLRMVLPPELHPTHELWGLPARAWTTAHVFGGIALTLLLFVHVVLHRAWIAARIARRAGAVPGWTIPASLAAAAGLFVLAAHLGVRESDRPVPPPTNGKVEFGLHIRPILEQACASCHAGKRPAAGFHVDRRSNYFSPLADGAAPLVVPGDAAASKLLIVVGGKHPGAAGEEVHALPPEQVRTIRKWIEQGAEWTQD